MCCELRIDIRLTKIWFEGGGKAYEDTTYYADIPPSRDEHVDGSSDSYGPVFESYDEGGSRSIMSRVVWWSVQNGGDGIAKLIDRIKMA